MTAGQEQRGAANFKSDDFNSRPNANTKFARCYVDVGQVSFAHALDLEYIRPGNYVKGELNGHEGFFFKKHGAVDYFRHWLEQQGHIAAKGICRRADH
eukprot:15323741-Alexandrium_andersonii.AAC.1